MKRRIDRKNLIVEETHQLNLSIKYKPLRSIQKLWENYLAFIIRAKSMNITLEVVK